MILCLIVLITNKLVCKRESINVLQRLITITNSTENPIIRCAANRESRRNLDILTVNKVVAFDLLDFPIKATLCKRLNCGHSFLHHGTKTMPRGRLPVLLLIVRLYADHCFDFMCHVLSFLCLIWSCSVSRY